MHHAYLNTRVTLLAKRLLPAAAWERLLAQPVEGDQEFLARHGLADMVAKDPEFAGRSLEQRMVTLLLRDILILSRALAGPESNFLMHWMHRFELANLKAIIRGKMAGKSVAEIRGGLMQMGYLGRLPLEDLLRTEDIAELLRQLQATPYNDIARAGRQAYEEQRDQFALDAAFDHRYYSSLVRSAQALEGPAAPRLGDLMAAQIDRINLIWLLRYRFIYALAPAQVYYLLIPSHYRLSRERLRTLTQLPTPDAVLRALPAPYARLLAGAASISEARLAMVEHGLALARTTLRQPQAPLARAFAYLLLREHDLRRLRAVVRGQHLALPAALIREAMGLAASPGMRRQAA